MNIREVDPKSSQEIELIASRMRSTLIEVLGTEKGTEMYSMEWLRDRVYWHLSPDRDAKILLAETRSKEIAGQAIVRIEQDDFGTSYGLFSTIYVAPEFRKQGIAQNLISEVENWCKNKRLPYMTYNTAQDNMEVINLFGKFGFNVQMREYGIVKLRKILVSEARKDGAIKVRFETDRLLLRDYTPEDWESVHIYGKDPEFSEYEPWGPNSIEDTKNFIADNIKRSKLNPRFHYEFAVCLKDGTRQIGGCGLRRDSQTSAVANMGWAINPEFQKQGYATEAASRLIQFGFEDLDLKVIYATCDTRNVASYKVMEKIGMKRVGHLIGNRNFKNEVSDSYRYEIIR